MVDKGETLCIGVLSDTHLPHRLPRLPSSVVELFANAAVDLVLHAGDVDDLRFLEPLSQVAPVIAVRGNTHVQDLSSGGAELPAHVALTFYGRRLVVSHGHWTGLLGFPIKVLDVVASWLGLLNRVRLTQRIVRQLGRRFPWADIIVFGHTHKSFQARIGGQFFFNPGAVCQDTVESPSVGLLTLGDEVLEAEIIYLEQG